MRVISIGHLGEAEAFCNHCGAELGYFPADVHRKRIGEKYFTYLYCPVCGQSIVLSSEDDPWKELID